MMKSKVPSKRRDSSSGEENEIPSKLAKKDTESDTASDSSGPHDKTPINKKVASKNQSLTGDEKKNDIWPLESTRAIRLNEFKGKTYVDIREFYMKGGESLPGKKGISLSINAWNKLCEVMDEVNDALKKRK